MIFEPSIAQGMRDLLDGIRDTVSVIVQWVNAPLIPSFMMRDVADPINAGVSQVHIARRHINF